MKGFVLLPALILVGCDRLSERIWNCSLEPVSVIKISDDGGRFPETIPARSYTASMKGGVQTVALQQDRKGHRLTIWTKGQRLLSKVATSADDACGDAKDGFVAEQF